MRQFSTATIASALLCLAQPTLASSPVTLTPTVPISKGISPEGAAALYKAIGERCSVEALYRPSVDNAEGFRESLIQLAGCVGQQSGRTYWAIYNGRTPTFIDMADIDPLFRRLYHKEIVLLPLTK